MSVTAPDVIRQLRAKANPRNVAGMARYGINTHNTLGVPIPALRAKGVSVAKCAGWAIFTSIPQPLFAVPAFLLVSVFQPLLPFGLGFAGGAMIFLVASELMPESIANCTKSQTAWGFMVGFVLMLLFTSGLGL